MDLHSNNKRLIMKIETFSRQNHKKLLNIIEKDIKNGINRIFVTGYDSVGKTTFYRLLKENKIDCFDIEPYCDVIDSTKIVPRWKEIPEDKQVYVGRTSEYRKFKSKYRIERVYALTATAQELMKEFKIRSEDQRRDDRDIYRAKSQVNESTIAYEQQSFLKGLK